MKDGYLKFNFDKDIVLSSRYHHRHIKYTIDRQKRQAFIAIDKLQKQQKMGIIYDLHIFGNTDDGLLITYKIT